MAQYVEDPVGGSAADNEILIAGPFRVGKNCWKDQSEEESEEEAVDVHAQTQHVPVPHWRPSTLGTESLEAF